LRGNAGANRQSDRPSAGLTKALDGPVEAPAMTEESASPLSTPRGYKASDPTGKSAARNHISAGAISAPSPASVGPNAVNVTRAKKTYFASRFKQITLTTLSSKIFFFLFTRNYDYLSPSRLDRRGASRSSRTLRRDAVGVSMLQRGLSAPTNNVDAHGQVAWF
jgi:hypothetical protein